MNSDETPIKATAYEPPELWDIGELVELTEEKKHHTADFQGGNPSDQSYFS